VSGVTMVPVGELMVSRGGSVNPLNFPDEDFDLYSIPAFDTGKPEVTVGADIGSTKQVVQPNDVLLSKIVPHIRRAWVVGEDRGRRLIGSGEWIVLRSERVWPEYLRHVLVGDPFHQQFMQTVSGVGGSLLRARPAFVAGISVPLPLLEEQRRIAAILDQAETLRTQRRQALTHLDTLTQSLFLEMFGDPVVNPNNLPVVKFGDVGTLDRGISKHRPRNAPELLGGSHPLVQTGEVSNCDGYIRSYTHTYSDIGLRQSKMWPAGTLCITIAANIAKTGILTFDACFPDSVVGFRADDSATVEYVRVWLSFLQKALEDSAPESAQKNINLAILRGLNIPLPSLALQQTFATRIAAIEALKATHRTALTQLDALFASLQQKAFSGELTATTDSAASRKQLFAELGKLDLVKGLEALVYAAKRLKGKGHYFATKVQYLAFRHHFKRHKRTICGDTFVAMPHGPVPQAAFNASRALAEDELICEFGMDDVRKALRREGDELIALRDAKEGVLSAEERKSLDWAIRYVQGMSFTELKTATHDSAYNKTAKNQPIAWQDIIASISGKA
jgi:type I restriction enzyme, S subunit